MDVVCPETLPHSACVSSKQRGEGCNLYQEQEGKNILDADKRLTFNGLQFYFICNPNEKSGKSAQFMSVIPTKAGIMVEIDYFYDAAELFSLVLNISVTVTPKNEYTFFNLKNLAFRSFKLR